MTHRLPVVVLALLLGGAAAIAQPGPGPAARRPAGPAMRHQLMERLNLTDQQKDQIAKLRADFQKKMIAQRAKVQSLRVDMRTEIGSDNPDRATIEKISRNINDVQGQMKLDRIDHLFAVKAVLTPEQQKTFKDEMMQLGGRAGNRMHRHLMGGMGNGMGPGSMTPDGE